MRPHGRHRRKPFYFKCDEENKLVTHTRYYSCSNRSICKARTRVHITNNNEQIPENTAAHTSACNKLEIHEKPADYSPSHDYWCPESILCINSRGKFIVLQ